MEQDKLAAAKAARVAKEVQRAYVERLLVESEASWFGGVSRNMQDTVNKKIGGATERCSTVVHAQVWGSVHEAALRVYLRDPHESSSDATHVMHFPECL